MTPAIPKNSAENYVQTSFIRSDAIGKKKSRIINHSPHAKTSTNAKKMIDRKERK